MNQLAILLAPSFLLAATIAFEIYIFVAEKRLKQKEAKALAQLDSEMRFLVAKYGEGIKDTESYRYYATMKR